MKIRWIVGSSCLIRLSSRSMADSSSPTSSPRRNLMSTLSNTSSGPSCMVNRSPTRFNRGLGLNDPPYALYPRAIRSLSYEQRSTLPAEQQRHARQQEAD